MESKKRIIDLSVDYIYEHINEPLVVKTVAEQFNFSEYYFNRIFKEVTGESVYALIKRIKLEQSAIALKTEKDRSITDIGLDYGYEVSNYSTAFKKQMAIGPAAYRKNMEQQSKENPFSKEQLEDFSPYEAYDKNISIEQLPDVDVIYERFKGSYEELREKWKDFLEKYKAYLGKDTWIIERFFDDPSVTDKEHTICDLCLSYTGEVKLANLRKLQGGKFAVYHYQGQIQDIYASLQGVYTKWLPQSGVKRREYSNMNIYRAIDWEQNFVIMDLYIPIK